MSHTDDATALSEELVTFTRRLDRAGVAVQADASLAAARALTALDEGGRERVRAALRAAVVGRPEDAEPFDRLFDVFWDRVTGDGSRSYPAEAAPTPAPVPSQRSAGTSGGAADESGEREGDEADEEDGGATTPPGGRTVDRTGDASSHPDGRRAGYSSSGASERVRTDAGIVRSSPGVAEAVDRFTDALANLPGRRWSANAGGKRSDERRAIRQRVSRGAPIPVPTRARRETVTHGTVLVDVSQSVLETIDRGFLLEFLGRLRSTWRRTRVFFFDTDLREVTDSVDAASPAAAAAALEDAQAEWGGGTRIGAAVGTLRDEHSDAVDRRTTVLVVSDGLERGDIERLSTAAAWLSGRARRVLWLNPLAVSPAYEPTCRGMQAVLPYLDGFYGFAGPADLERIADSLSRHGPERSLDPARGESFDGRATETHRP